MARIKQLSSALANKIAAGEVVARPASVVKECIENSIDAKSTSILLEVQQGGIQLIRITDNGEGIEKEDLPLALAAHATSKIDTVEDLMNIHSLGFRGEALASIAAVSHFTLASRPKGQKEAWQIVQDKSYGEANIMLASLLEGTRVSVEALFFNVPARRKFLRGPKTELLHIMTVVKSLALSHFYVGFTVKDENKVLAYWPAVAIGEESKRIEQVVGNDFLEHALSVDFSGEDLRLWGWLGLPEKHRSHSDCQYIFVNGRMVQDRVLTHGIRQAYGHALPEGRYGAYVLYLELPPSEVDVNVHPTKREVRFLHSRLVHDFIVTQLQSALNSTQDILAEEDSPTLWDITPEKKPFSKSIDSALIMPKKDFSVREANVPYQIIHGRLPVETSQDPTSSVKDLAAVPYSSKVCEEAPSLPSKSRLECMGVFERNYALINYNEQLYGVHIPRAVAFYYTQNSFQTVLVKPLLIPMALTCEESKIIAMEKCYESWLVYGLSCETFSKDTVIVRGLPKLNFPIKFHLDEQVVLTGLERLLSQDVKNADAIKKTIGTLLGEWVLPESVVEAKEFLSVLLTMNINKPSIVMPVNLSDLFIK